MDSFFSAAFAATSSAAAGPFALFAYLAALIAYVICFLRIRRNQALLNKIEKIPDHQRVAALRNEMSGIPVPADIKPKHWLAARRQRYNTIIALVSLLLVVSIMVLAYIEYKGKVSVVIGVQQSSLEKFRPSGFLAQIIPTANAAELNFVQPEENPLSDIDLRYPGQEIDIGYRQASDEQQIVIEPNFRYLDRLKSQQVVDAIDFNWEPFTWKFPELSFKVLNDSSKQLYLSNIEIKVDLSKVDTDPLLVVPEMQGDGEIVILNYGWGDVIEPQVSLNLTEYRNACPTSTTARDFTKVTYSENVIRLDAFEFEEDEFFDSLLMCAEYVDTICAAGECAYDSDLSNIKCRDQEKTRYLDRGNTRYCRETNPKVPQSLVDDFLKDINGNYGGKKQVRADDVMYGRECYYGATVCALGQLAYKTEDGDKEVFNFRMLVNLNPLGAGAPAPPTYTYDVFLPAGKANYKINVPISQVIPPGMTDHFLLRIATDKSAHFNLRVSLYDTEEKTLAESDVDLRTVVPRGTRNFFQD